MSLEVTGKLIQKGPVQQIKDTFKKREFVLDITEEVNGNSYANYASLQLVQAKCDILDRFNEGDTVKVSFNIRGNRYEKDGIVKYFTSLDAWRIEHAAAAAAVPAGAPAYAGAGAGNTVSFGGSNGGYAAPAADAGDDLPF